MFQRKPLRDDVQKEILNRIVDGRLPAGRRINETHLAADMGLSRTPLREAMITLTGRGFLGSVMGRGFEVPPLERTRFLEIQDMLHHLEPIALVEAAALSPQTVMELNNLINRARMKLGREPVWPEQAEALTVLVYRWSDLALETCRNQTLRQEILRLQGLSSRYWFAVARKGLPWEDMLQSYVQIYEALRGGQTEAGGQLWGDHTARFAKLAATALANTTVG